MTPRPDTREAAREVAREEIDDALIALDVGLPGSERRRTWTKSQQWLEAYSIKREKKREQRLAALNGLLWSLLGTGLIGALSWLGGVLPWVVQTLGPAKP